MTKHITIYIVIIILLFAYNPLHAVSKVDTQLDSIFSVLDKAIKERHLYAKTKNDLIQNLKGQLQQLTTIEDSFYVYGRIYNEYKTFQMDSALAVVNKRMQLASRTKDTESTLKFSTKAEQDLAEVMMVTGMYKESLDILNKLDRSIIIRHDYLSSLYHLYHSLYMLMAQYSFTEKGKDTYLMLQYQYKDSILTTITPNEAGYQLVESSKLLHKKKYDEALDLSMKAYLSNTDNNRTTATTARSVSEVYLAMGDTLSAMKYLGFSAIADLRTGVKEYMSLPELANLLYAWGDIEHSYNYIKCSMEDAIFCNARLRAMEMSRMLPIINASYDVKMKQERSRLILFLVTIVILFVALTVLLIFIYKKLKELSLARRSLDERNTFLQQTLNEMKILNIELSESNHVKEEYIGYVFNICSTYINKLDDFRKLTNRKIKSGLINELLKLTDSSSFVTDELKEFYRSFDSIFLNIYPDFIEDFNSLLMDNEHIYPKEGELLCPELRIYALVRLGISDSVKIASFLHYSPQTVYNYRFKVRNKAKVEKDKFPELVRQLGLVRE